MVYRGLFQSCVLKFVSVVVDMMGCLIVLFVSIVLCICRWRGGFLYLFSTFLLELRGREKVPTLINGSICCSYLVNSLP